MPEPLSRPILNMICPHRGEAKAHARAPGGKDRRFKLVQPVAADEKVQEDVAEEDDVH